MTIPWSLPPLSPKINGTIACTDTSKNVSLGVTLANGNRYTDGPNTVQIVNSGTNEAFVAFGGSDVTVTAQGTITASNDGGSCVPGGAVLAFTANLPAETHVAAICGSGLTTTLRLSRGYGS